VQSYALYRDGVLLERDVRGTTFTDTATAPGREYTYEIEAVAANGSVSDRVAVAAETHVPPLGAARLANDFAVTARFLDKSGYGDYGVPTFGWTFRPLCRKEACDVVWRDLHEKQIRTRLERRGKRYRGSYTGFFGMQCGSTYMTSSVALTLEVTMARVVEGRWVATHLKGRVEQAESEQLGCRSSRATLAVNGRLVR
jgi:hypothetical protein